ncbi:MAG: hypothetical protein GPOALKHO_001901 [Sodalis sp.]|nr:MAG: hypothetical protein GPOALKHO_001901 [Sodalis sp.]
MLAAVGSDSRALLSLLPKRAGGHSVCRGARRGRDGDRSADAGRAKGYRQSELALQILYRHGLSAVVTPPVILRNILKNPNSYTTTHPISQRYLMGSLKRYSIFNS